MQIVQFFDLERSIQDRFIASTHGNEVPSPLLYEPPQPNPKARILWVTSASLLAVLAVLAFVGFGRLGHPFAKSPLYLLPIYAALAAGAAVTILAAYRLWNADDSLPFKRGLFLYPVGVIDARHPALVVHEMASRESLEAVGAKVRITFRHGTRFEFHAVSPEKAEATVDSLTQAQSRMSMAPGEHSQREGVLQSPLLDTGFPNPFGPTQKLQPEAQGSAVVWYLGVLLTGLAAGSGGYVLRDLASVRSLYGKARAADTTRAYTDFLRSGAKQEDVTQILLPRAQLRDATRAGTSDAIEHFLASHPKSQIESEALVALRAVMLRELGGAVSQGTLSALRQFRKDDPQRKLVEHERQAAETLLYRAALSKYQAASTQVPAHAEFMARLLEYSRTHGGKVEVRFRRRYSDTVEKTEAQVKKSAYYIGPPALPAQYFDAARTLPRETRVATALVDRFSEFFPKDMLEFTVGEPLADEATETPKVQVPTLLITHKIDMSGPFTSMKPRGAFVGVGFAFKAAFLVPEDPNALAFQVTAWMPPNLRKLEEEHKPLAEMYGGMADDAFSRFQSKFLAFLFQSKAN